MIVQEIPRDDVTNAAQWNDLANDVGVSDDVRLILQATMMENPAIAIPNNYGDPLLNYEYGMRYGTEAVFEYTTLVMPTIIAEVEVQNMWMGASIEKRSVQATAKVGEPYTVKFLLWNHGDDGITMVDAYANGALIAQKQMAVSGGSWRICAMDLVFEAAGEYELTIGSLSAKVTVE
jgi:hypothetical protein